MSRRSTKKAKQDIQARYDAGGMGRRMAGWNAPSSGPNRAVQGLPKIRDRSRDAVRNDWSGKSGVQHWTTNLIGTGIVPRLKRIANEVKKLRYADLWDRWTTMSDADGVLNFYGQETLATKSWLISGEVFGRLRYRRPDVGMEVPLQVQLIESDFVPMLDADNWPGLPKYHRIRSGIELNSIGQRVAYWVYKEHPGDGTTSSIDAGQLIRVPAAEMMHIFEPERPGQLRGVPDFAPVLARLRNVADFDDAVLERQKLANLFAMFVKKIIPQNWDGADTMTGLPIGYDSSGVPMVGLQPGTSQELLPGEEVQFSNPPDAGTNYSEYMRSQNLGTAAGQGLPYEIMTGDIANVSDRTLRVVINEFRRYAEQRQWQIIIPMFCQKVRDAWVDQAVLVGKIAMADAEDAKRVEWAPHGWQYIHPVQDAQGKQLEVESGFRSRSSVIAERGEDPEQVDAERAADKERAEKLGLEMPPPDPNAEQEPSPQEKAATARIRAEESLLLAQASAAERTAAAEEERARAYAQAQSTEAERARAEAAYHLARAGQADAESRLSQAKVDKIQADATLAAADAELRRALVEKESEARIAECQERAAAAQREVDARIEAVKSAEAFAQEQRTVVLDAERARAATAKLELEAAQVGLEELRGE